MHQKNPPEIEPPLREVFEALGIAENRPPVLSAPLGGNGPHRAMPGYAKSKLVTPFRDHAGTTTRRR